ncbi:MAG: hypothetical protein JOZ73_02235, partial [Solirubrobacterales bacterium]|nr:hypothetical protein [Solirubrobacterales bacterium]
MANAPVVLYQRLYNQQRFHPAGRTQTDSQGRYAIVLRRVRTTRSFYVTVKGTSSPVIRQRVSALITLVASDPNPYPQQSIVLHGHVAPSYGRHRIRLEQRIAGRWQVISRTRLSRASNYSVTRSWPRNPKVLVRAVLPANSRNKKSQSVKLLLKVIPLHKIKHVVVIMQENRSFDSYFGTYPGADGIPPGVCNPDPQNGGCVKPFHNFDDTNFGGPHGVAAYTA